MRNFVAIVAVCLMAVLPARAEEAQTPQLTVTGMGRVEVVPDMARLTLGVTEEAKDPAAALEAVSTRMTGIFEQIKAAGVAPRDMQSSQVNLSPRHDYKNNRDQIIGFVARSTVSITLRDLSGLGALMTAAAGSGANEIHGLNFDVQDRSAAMDDARRLAVKDALSRAEVLAGAAGLKPGRVVLMREGGGSGPQPQFARMAMESASADMPIAAGELEISSAVTMVIELVEE